MKTSSKLWALLRIAMGWIFLWPFLDKLFGLGFTTTADKSWLAGTSPTTGFLSFGTEGPFATGFQSLAGQAWVDWLFMLGLMLIGLALILGIGMRVAAYAGALLLVLMWLATFPPEHNPVLDEHILYALTLFGLLYLDAGQWWGFSKPWSKTKLVKKHTWLK